MINNPIKKVVDRLKHMGVFGKKEPWSLDSSILFDVGSSEDVEHSLRVNGRLACRVLVQVLRRSGVDTTKFKFLAEFDDKHLPSYRLLVEMPSHAALDQKKCCESEHTAKIELDMRHGVYIGAIFWRVDVASVESSLQSVFLGPTTTERLVGNESNYDKPSARVRTYPASIRVNTIDRYDKAFADTER